MNTFIADDYNVMSGAEATWGWGQGETSDYEECGLQSCLGVRGSTNYLSCLLCDVADNMICYFLEYVKEKLV